MWELREPLLPEDSLTKMQWCTTQGIHHGHGETKLHEFTPNSAEQQGSAGTDFPAAAWPAQLC